MTKKTILAKKRL